MKGWTPQKIKRVREAAGLTQAQLAEWLGVTKMHVSHLEQGVRPPGPQTVRLLCVLLGRAESGLRRYVQREEARGAYRHFRNPGEALAELRAHAKAKAVQPKRKRGKR